MPTWHQILALRVRVLVPLCTMYCSLWGFQACRKSSSEAKGHDFANCSRVSAKNEEFGQVFGKASRNRINDSTGYVGGIESQLDCLMCGLSFLQVCDPHDDTAKR
jgi:hypothetical protein